MIESFSLEDTDDGELIKLDVQFIENDIIMFSIMDKTTGKEIAVTSVYYSDLLSGIEMLRRPGGGRFDSTR